MAKFQNINDLALKQFLFNKFYSHLQLGPLLNLTRMISSSKKN